MSDFLPPVAVILSASITELKAKLGEATAEMEGFQTHTEKISNVGKIAFGALAGGVAAVGVESLKMAGDFQQQTSLLVTAAGESASHLGLVRNGILDIAKATGAGTEQLSEGMYQIEKAGIRGADGLKVLKAAAEGAAEEGANLSTVTNAMTSIMASYNIPASQSVEVMNALKTAAGGSKDTMENFSSSLSTVLPIASAAGLDFAQVGGAIAGLTRHGTSAAEATQELAFTIRNLQKPNALATKAMEQMGISSVEVSSQLGKRGLGGTLEYLVDTIGQHMGPQGLVMIDTFKQSQSAAHDLTAMISGMPPELAKLADAYRNGSLTMGEFAKATSGLPAPQANLAHQFETLANRSTGFSDALRKGNPQAQTFAAALASLMGGSTALNTALMLTGNNQAYVDEMTQKTSASIKNHTTDVEGWKATAKLLNVQLGQLHQDLNTMAIALGQKLIPAVTSTIGWFQRHKTEAEVLATVVGGGLTIAIGTYLVGALKSASEALTLTGRAAQLFGVQAAEGEAAAELPLLPWIAAVTLVGIAAYELYKHWDQVWAWIKSATSAAWGFIDKHMVLIGALFGPVALAATALYKNWDAVWSGIKTAVQSAWDFIRPIIDQITGAVSSVTGAVSSVTGAVSSVTGAAHTVLGGVGSTLHNIGIPGFATGTDYAPGGLAWVGERGPELVHLPRGSRVTPNGQSSAMGGGGSAVIDLHVHLDGAEIHRSVQTHELQYQMRNARRSA